MTRMVSAAISLLFVAGSGGQAGAGYILSPVAIPVDPGTDFPGYLDIGNTIDQSGLSIGFVSGATDFDAYIASNPTHTYVTLFTEWFGRVGVAPTTIVYDLGGLYNVHRLALWNEEISGIASMTVSTSTDLTFSASTPAGSFIPADTPNVRASYPAQVFDLTDSIARYVRLQVTGPQEPAVTFALSMGEIAFDVTAAPIAVPEPTTMALTCSAGSIGLGFWLKRSRKASVA